MSPSQIAVKLRGLGKAYASGDAMRPVIEDLQMEVMRGEQVALLGRSGSGKSTLLNLLAGIDAADQGSVWVNGRDIGGLGEPGCTLYRRREVGFIYQFFNLIASLTARENVLLPLELLGVEKSQARQRSADLLEQVGLSARADDFPEHLSGGEQQRVAIARALVHRPSLVLADEPTGSLDADTGEQVAELLRRLCRDLGATLLLVTHSLDLAHSMDRVLRLDHGRLVSVEP
ncbi:MAG: ABC transporter ATP-binding protein [Chromatiales bacterium]|nr:ABC transporter ATP-binding protein [Chromatiales bacterium]